MKQKILFCLLVSFAASGFAQDGTPLAAKGVGEFTGFAGSWSAGMGNSGIALIRSGFLSPINPATWTGLENVQFTASYNYSGLSSKDDSIKPAMSSYYSNGDFGGGIFALPMDRDLGLTLAGGFTPLTSYNFTISSPWDSTPDIPSYTYKSVGSGGLGEGFVGLSLSPFNGLNLGGMFQYAFGRIENVRNINFNNSSYTNTYSDYSSYLRGPGGTVGVVLDSIDKIIRLNFLSGLSLGGYYKFAYNLTGSSVLENLYADSLYSPFSQNANAYIPPEYGFGVSKAFGNYMSGVLDVRFQPFSKYHDSYTPAGSLKDALFIGGGVEVRQGRGFGSLYDTRILRAGIYYQKTQFVVQTRSGGSRQLDELFLTAGIEVPISLSAAASVSAQYGFRGLSSDFLEREQIFRLYFSVTMGDEGWFYQPRGD